MFKNLRDKLAVLALIALGLAFGQASGMKPAEPTKTNGELIYEAIEKCQLPDGDGNWTFFNGVPGKDGKPLSSDTSLEGVDTLEKIKIAIGRLLRNDDVVKYITIHNIASGHMYDNANGFGEINAVGVPRIDGIKQGQVQLLKALAKEGLTGENVSDAIPYAFDNAGRFYSALFVGALRYITRRENGFRNILGINANMSQDITPLFLLALYGDKQINVPLYDIKTLDLKYYHIGTTEEEEQAGKYSKVSNDCYPIRMYMAYNFIRFKGEQFLDDLVRNTKEQVIKFLDNDRLIVDVYDESKQGKQQLSLTSHPGTKCQKLILDIHKTHELVYISHFGPVKG